MVNTLDLKETMETAEPLGMTGLVQLLCSLCAMYKNTGEIGFLLNKRKKLKPFIQLGLSLLKRYDPDWVRTSDPHPVKVVLSQLSYGIKYVKCLRQYLI